MLPFWAQLPLPLVPGIYIRCSIWSVNSFFNINHLLFTPHGWTVLCLLAVSWYPCVRLLTVITVFGWLNFITAACCGQLDVVDMLSYGLGVCLLVFSAMDYNVHALLVPLL